MFDGANLTLTMFTFAAILSFLSQEFGLKVILETYDKQKSNAYVYKLLNKIICIHFERYITPVSPVLESITQRNLSKFCK